MSGVERSIQERMETEQEEAYRLIATKVVEMCWDKDTIKNYAITGIISVYKDDESTFIRDTAIVMKEIEKLNVDRRSREADEEFRNQL